LRAYRGNRGRVAVTIGRGKTDQEGAGATIARADEVICELLRPGSPAPLSSSLDQGIDIRKHGQYLGTVEATNEKAAEAAAVTEFDLSDEQRRRLAVQERN
jgi:hypothetical protein